MVPKKHRNGNAVVKWVTEQLPCIVATPYVIPLKYYSRYIYSAYAFRIFVLAYCFVSLFLDKSAPRAISPIKITGSWRDLRLGSGGRQNLIRRVGSGPAGSGWSGRVWRSSTSPLSGGIGVAGPTRPDPTRPDPRGLNRPMKSHEKAGATTVLLPQPVSCNIRCP